MTLKSIIQIIGLALFSVSCKMYNDTAVIESIYENALSDSTSYHQLEYLTNQIGGRLACSPVGIRASLWTKSVMEQMDLDNVFLQEAIVKNWDRGEKESASIKSRLNGSLDVEICALGRGIGTEGVPLTAQIVEVNGLSDLENLSTEQIKGKIIFFNQHMNESYKNTFRAYSEAAGQRFYGPIEAAKHGAVGVVIRSLTTSIDEFPHTGVTAYAEDGNTVPSVCISTRDANVLSDWLWEDPDLEFSFTTNCQNKPDTISYNVIGEIKGSEFSDKIITIGGHLDSWDIDPGAHDDGGGCIQAIEVLRLFKELGIKPRHTIRAVMFMDEEISQGGAKAYADEARESSINHIFALESDRGVTQPYGFSFDAPAEIINKISTWSELFEPYQITTFIKGGGGVDIAPLKEFNTPLAGLLTDPTNYFDWHHSANDTFNQINFEEFQRGAAAMAALIYLIDKYGL